MINWFCEINGRPKEMYIHIYMYFFFLDRGFKTAFGEMNRQISASALATGKILIDRANNANRRFKVNDGTFG